MSRDHVGLPPGEVLADAAAVLRQLADAATPGRRSFVAGLAKAGDERVAAFRAEGDAMLWAAFGPDEARLLADLLDGVRAGWPHGYNPTDSAEPEPEDAAALDLAYALTGHRRPDGGK